MVRLNWKSLSHSQLDDDDETEIQRKQCLLIPNNYSVKLNAASIQPQLEIDQSYATILHTHPFPAHSHSNAPLECKQLSDHDTAHTGLCGHASLGGTFKL